MKIRLKIPNADVLTDVPKWSGIVTVLVWCLMSVPTGVAQDTAVDQASDTFTKTVKPFLRKHCIRCHDAKRASAGFRIDELPADFQAAKTADHWLEVMDKINIGEMPPEGESQPVAAEFEPIVDWISVQLRDVELAARNAGGRIPMRRLNRVEYINTVRDLLFMDPLVLAPLQEDLPNDGTAEGFDRLGIALYFDQTQIEQTIAVAVRIADQAIVVDRPKNRVSRYEFEDNPRIKGFRQRVKSRFADTLVDAGPSGAEIIDGGVRVVHGYGNRSSEQPWGRLGATTLDEVVTEDGYYRIRLRAGASTGSRGEPIQVRMIYGRNTPVQTTEWIPIDASLDEPQVVEAVVFLRCGPQGLKRTASFSFNDISDLIIPTPESSRIFKELRTAIGAVRRLKNEGAPDNQIAAAAKALEEIREHATKWQGSLRYHNPERDHKQPPTIFVDWAEVSGPVLPEWPPKSHTSVFFDGDQRQDAVYVREIFARLLPRAYRRPTTEDELDGVVELVLQARSQGKSLHEAIRTGVVRVLCSPGFLFIQEPVTDQKPRSLTDYELASRLSYFLWSTMPDDKLFALAASGRLSDPSVLMDQVDVMLDDPKAEALVQGFAGQWLSVRDFGSVEPAAEYSDHHDEALEQASRLEAYAFFREVLSKDLPVTNFLNSDFVMINERLAKHYGVDGVEGAELRRVTIEPNHHRGGVLGMAGLMTFLSDGTRTLPVRRAAWVKTQLFGDPPRNPPPNAGEIQPNTAGQKLTVRQRLDLHRNESTCASCHKKLDPFGIALENYDAVGMWRTKANGEGFRGKRAPDLDVSSDFPNGDPFDSLESYKAGLLKRKDEFTRNLVKQVMTYALTRPIGYSDRQTVDAITQTVRSQEYRLRTLIREVIRSELFQSK